jgi:hypothetical protein
MSPGVDENSAATGGRQLIRTGRRFCVLIFPRELMLDQMGKRRTRLLPFMCIDPSNLSRTAVHYLLLTCSRS